MAREMKLIGFNFVRVIAEKDPTYEGKIELNTHMNIASVEKHKLELVKDDALKIAFSFNATYGKLGKVELHGVLFLLVDSKTQKEAIKSWEDKKLPEDIQLAVLNTIMQKSSLKALQIEEDLGLPLHMQMPRLQPGSAEKK